MGNFDINNKINLDNIVPLMTGPLTMTKVVDKATGVVGDVLTYSITIQNPSNSGITTSQITIQDTIPVGTTYVPGTLLVNGSPSTEDINAGFLLPSLNPGEAHQIVFKVLVQSFPNGKVKNDATMKYTWGSGGTIPNEGGNTGSAQTVPGPDPQGRVLITKSVDKTNANVGDEIVYTLAVFNIGSVTVNNVIVKDTIPTDTSYVANSTSINGGTSTNSNPQNGITLGTLNSGEGKTVTFRVKIDRLPTTNPIPNQGILGFEYTNNSQTVTAGGLTGFVFTTVTEPQNKPSIKINKAVDKIVAAVGEEITYTVVLTNDGGIAYTNLFFVDTLPNDTAFISSSVTVNGITQPTFNPTIGFNLNTSLGVNGVNTVTFKVKALTIPNPNPIVNIANGIYSYQGGSSSSLSNEATTTIEAQGVPDISIIKAVDKVNANILDEIVYTIVLKNVGTLPLTNVIFTDTLEASNISFVNGSLTVNGISNSGSPISGVTLPNFWVGDSLTVMFKVKIDTIPSPNPIPNTSKVDFTYTPNGGQSTQSSKESNLVSTTVAVPTVPSGVGDASIVKAVDKVVANVLDELTYTSVIRNTGSLPLTNIIFTDTLEASNISFIQNSAIVNGVVSQGDPTQGINISDIPVGSSAFVVFKVKVNSLPSPNPIPNKSKVGFSYTLGTSIVNSEKLSNLVNTNVLTPTVPSGIGDASIVKAVDKVQANVLEELTYTSVIKNTGNLPLTNLIFTDTLEASNISFVTGSLNVNGISNSGSPVSGVTLPNLGVLESTTITFKIKIDTIPNPNPIPNTSKVGFSYTLGTSIVNSEKLSNLVNTTVLTPTVPSGIGNASIVKAVDKTEANVLDELTYTSVITNTGNLPLTNVIFTDTIESSNVSFIQNSAIVNGVQNIGDPSQGINISNIPVGSSAFVVFKVKVNSLPNPNPIPNKSKVGFSYTLGTSIVNSEKLSNLVNTNVLTPTVPSGVGDASIVKAVDKVQANILEEVTYTSVIKNTGNLPLTNLIFTDTLEASNISFVTGSLNVNGVSNSGSPVSGVTLPNLGALESVTIIFKIKIDTIPNPNPIPNTSKVGFSYTLGTSIVNSEKLSNLVNTNVLTPTVPSGIGNASIVKAVDKTEANVLDELTYTSVITNTGNLPLTNVIFTDTIESSNVSFIQNSAIVNGVQNVGDPSQGIAVSNIPVGSSAFVVFKVKINSLPNPNPIPNKSKVDFKYTPNGGVLTSKTKESNTVFTSVKESTVTLEALKSVDKSVAETLDILTYTVSISNRGNTKTDVTIFKDIIPGGTSLVEGSILVDGIPANGSLDTGIFIGEILPSTEKKVTFKVKVLNFPSVNPITNSAKVDYTYTVSNAEPPKTGEVISNTVNTLILQKPINPATDIIKEVDKAYAKVGDVLTYTITVKNSGDVMASNVTFKDTIPKEASFIKDSVIIDGISRPGIDPEIGFLLGDILPKTQKKITFKVTVITLPLANPIKNNAVINYEYKINPIDPPKKAGGISNPATTEVREGSISNENGGLIKEVDKNFAKVGDEITYTIKATNKGNVPVENVILIDTLPSDTSFIVGSVTVNGIGNILLNPALGIPLGTINMGETKEVKFRVKIIKLPDGGLIENTSQIGYSYTLNPNNPNGEMETNISNKVSTLVSEAIIVSKEDIIKTVNSEYGKLSDILSYSVKITNRGNVKAENVIFKDKIPDSTSYVINSFAIDGGIIPGANPDFGVNIGSIDSFKSKVVTFNVTVIKIPSDSIVENNASIDFEYVINPITGEKVKESSISNMVTTRINEAIIDVNKGDLLKTVDKEYAKVLDILTYTIKIRNSGNGIARDVVFRDILEKDISFVENSVIVNGQNKLGENPEIGIILGNINPKGEVILSFKAKVIKMPEINPIPNKGSVKFRFLVDPIKLIYENRESITNTVFTKVNEATFNGGIIKSTSKTFAMVGDEINYTISLKNTGNVPSYNTVLYDLLQDGLEFLKGSVLINGVLSIAEDLNKGINLGVIAANTGVIVQFKAKVIKIPSKNPIENKAILNFDYKVNPNSLEFEKSTDTSNSVFTKVNSPNIENGGIVKEVDKNFAEINEVLTYKVKIKNIGNVDALNLVIKDTIPQGTSFIEGSVTLNGNSIGNVNLENGIEIGTLKSGEEVILSYKVKVLEIPKINPIPNEAKAFYSFILNPTEGTLKNVEATSNTVFTKVNSPNINNDNNSVYKTVNKEFAKVLEEITYTIYLENKGNVMASNVVITDKIREGTKFKLNSVKINDILQEGKNPELGINVGNVMPKDKVKLSYVVTVITIPKVNPIENSAKVNYLFTKDPSKPNGEMRELITNSVYTKINDADINSENGGIVKSVDKKFADISEELTYTVKLKNTGNVVATNIIFKDTIPKETEFIEGSIRVNGLVNRGNIEQGINIGDLNSLEEAFISFKVRVVKVIDKNIIDNEGRVSYTFTKNPASPNGEKEESLTNKVSTIINYADISKETGGLEKFVSQKFFKVLDIVTYKVNLKNNGNVDALDVMFIDEIIKETKFVENSVKIDGIEKPILNPEKGFSLGIIPVGGVKEVSFKVQIMDIPSQNPMPNSAIVKYKYLIDPITNKYGSRENKSNEVLAKVNSAIIKMATKKVDKPYADLKEEITYTIKATNSGNVDAINVLVKDVIEKGTSFVLGSVSIDGIKYLEANPEEGIIINKIMPNQTIEIMFKAKVTDIPSPNRVNNKANLKYSFVVEPITQKEATGEITTNITTTTINNGNIKPGIGGLSKVVDKNYAKINEELTYTIKVINSGNVPVNKLIVFDSVPDGTTFINNSILINGEPSFGENIESGINLNTLQVNDEKVISYKVLVTSLPKDMKILNKARATYSYTVNPNEPNGVSKEVSSNYAITEINFANIISTKNVDKNFSDLGEELLYTITLKNTGNARANNIVIKDILESGLEFKVNTVNINNSLIIGANPERGIDVGSMASNEITIVSFKALVVSIPKGEVIENKGEIRYNYTKNPLEINKEIGVSKTNVVETKIKTAKISSENFIKSADKRYVKLFDVVTYSFKIKNTGNIEALNVTLTDLIPKEMKFVENSFSIDGVIHGNVKEVTKVNIGNINSGALKVIEFKALVVSIPKDNKVVNKGHLEYSYVVDRDRPLVKKEVDSNIAEVTVNSASITNKNGSFVKSVNKEFGKIGEELTYTIKVENSGNVRANNVVVRDTIPKGSKFVEGSVKINGVSGETLNPQTGIGLLVLEAGETKIIEFKVLVVNPVEDFKIKNKALIRYEFIVDPVEVPVKEEGETNTVITKINTVSFSGDGFKKSVSEKYANLGDVVSYTFDIENKGNIIAMNVVFTDKLPKGLSFVEGSVEANNIKLDYANPIDGISLGTIGVNKKIVLNFKVRVDDLPEINPVSNIGELTYMSVVNPMENPVKETVKSNKEDIFIKDPKLSLIKEANKKQVIVSEIVDFKIKVQNRGNIEILKAKVKDSLSENLEFVEGSVKINGEERLNENITSGIVIENIKISETVIISFKAKVISRPKSGKISNIAYGIYSYILDVAKEPIGEEIKSNEIILDVNVVDVSIEKKADLKIAKLDDIITYYVKVKNIGNIDILNGVFIDKLPQEVELLKGSFKVNGKTINAINEKQGVALGDIKVLEEINISYKVKVVKACCKKLIVNEALVEFNYKIADNSPIKNRTSEVAVTKIQSQSPSFKQMNIDGVIKLKENLPEIEEVNEIFADITITDKYVIKTAKGISNENAKLTGYKLIINGYINERVEYTSLTASQSNHYTCNLKKFSTFIILPEEFSVEGPIEVTAVVEDVLFNRISKKSIYTNITFNLDATISC